MLESRAFFGGQCLQSFSSNSLKVAAIFAIHLVLCNCCLIRDVGLRRGIVPVPANTVSGIQGPTTDASSTWSYYDVCVACSLFVFPLLLFSSLFTSSAVKLVKFRSLLPPLLVTPYTRRLVFLSPRIILGIFDLFSFSFTYNL